MKKLLLLIIVLAFSFHSQAQQTIHIHSGASIDSHTLFEGDSIYFDAAQLTMYFLNNGNVLQYEVAAVDSITFSNDLTQNIYIHYNGDMATVTNPMANAGVVVTTNGAHVVVQSTSLIQDINYVLSGTTGNGSFKMYSEKRYNVLLNSVSLSNPIGPAINLQSTKKATLHLLSGSMSYLADGAIYDAAPVVSGVAEDQKATLFCEADLDILGSGSLSIQSIGTEQHAIASDEEIEILEGEIDILSAARDGIHASEGYYHHGGRVIVSSSGDGIDAEMGMFEMTCGDLTIHSSGEDVKAVRSDTLVVINGGWLVINSTGNQSKGIDCLGRIEINNGLIDITSSGLTVLVSNDPAYCSMITADGQIQISGGEINLTSTGKGGRGISGNGDVQISGGEINIVCSGNGQTYTNTSNTADAYHSTCIKVDGNLNITGGELSASNSGTGGKGIDVDGQFIFGDGTADPIAFVTTTGSNITISGGGGGGGPGGGNNGVYDKAKALRVDGNFYMNNGQLTSDSNDDGIKCNSTITIDGGTLVIANSVEGIEAPFITVNGGDVSIKATDDGFNATHGSGGEGSDGSLLTVNGGYVHIDASGGDAVDSNGNIAVNGGIMVVHGPQSSPEVGMDYNGSSLIHSGFVIISGTNSNMTQGFGNASTQRSLILKTSQSLAANTIIHVQDANGNEVFTFKPIRSYYSIVFSSELIVQGASYTIYTSGSSTGTAVEGLVNGGSYTPGISESTFTVTNMVTTVNF